MTRNRRLLLFIALGIVACVALLAALGVGGLLLFRQANEPPGEGAKAERGYAASAPVIAALEAYHAQHSEYPAALTDLVPDFLPAAPGPVNDYPLEYRLTDTSYSLEFSYTGPGMNHCAYTPEAGWDCYGFY